MRDALAKTLRWSFAVLLLLNIGLLMWARWYRVAPMDETRTPLPAVNAERMIPLSAPGLALQARPVVHKPPTPAASAALTPEPPAKPRNCVSIGPFESNELAQQSSKRLTDAKLAYVARTDANRIESSYWIYLPRLPNRKAAENRQKELTRLGLTDHYIMQDAGMENVISLGLFTQLDNARNRMEELAKKGIKAKQETRYRTRTLYWLDLVTDNPSELMAGLKKMGWTENEIQLRAQACGDEAAGAAPLDGAPEATGKE